jgi:hypothetical protein
MEAGPAREIPVNILTRRPDLPVIYLKFTGNTVKFTIPAPINSESIGIIWTRRRQPQADSESGPASDSEGRRRPLLVTAVS